MPNTELFSSDEKEPPSSNQNYYSLHTNFYQKHFPKSSINDWQDWKWQLKNRIITHDKLSEFINFNKKERDNFKGNLPLSITPYYLSLINSEDINDPLRKTCVPSSKELIHSPEEESDPLDESHQSPVKYIVHRYPDRVLFLASNFCSTDCRYCTRSRIISESNCNTSQDDWNKGFQYIKDHPEIRDVLISGGDPLTLSNENIEFLLSNIRQIEHVEMIRIGTKIPAVLPQRITPELLNILKKYHPLFISLHFTHPNEFTSECKRACENLADIGIPLGSQTVLLKDINDDHNILRKLFTGLLKYRVRPYYLYNCDLVSGTKHFRTSIGKGLEIMKLLRGYISGYAIPQFIVDLPKGGGKIPLLPNYIELIGNKTILFKNYRGEVIEYVN